MRRLTQALLIFGLFLTFTACAATRTADPLPAAAELQKLGGQFTPDEKAPGKPIIGLNLSNVPITDATLVYLDAFPHLQQLDLGHTKKLQQATITDAGLIHVAPLKELRRLSLTSTPVTDHGLAQLQGLTHLESLNLEGTKVTDAGLKQLKSLTHLQRLKLAGSKVTDAGVEKLQQALPQCKITF